MKKIIIIITLLACSSFSHASDLSGLWVWENNSTESTFSITLIKSKKGYKGTYCAVGMAGNRIDCSPEYAKHFNFQKNNKPFEFTTNYSNANGVAKLKENNNKLTWEIIKEPSGEHYAPKNANLKKQK